MNFPLRFLATLALCSAPAFAGPLQQAAINQIVKDVKVVDPTRGARPAALHETIQDDLAVKTGIESRAELLFQDQTLTRLGAETFFSFKAGTRDLTLSQGTLLLQVPKGRGGARIRTASVTASITGTTIMMELLPKSHLKVVVLEGSLRLSPNGRIGEAMLLTAGKMVIMKPDAKRIPEPVNVDLRKIMKTSALIDPAAFKGKSKANPAPLPSVALIENEIFKQDALIKERGLVATNLVIAGGGTEVTIATEQTIAALERGILTRAEAAVKAVTPEPVEMGNLARPAVVEVKPPLPTKDEGTSGGSVVVVDPSPGTGSGTGTGTGTSTGTGTGTGTPITFEVLNTSSLTDKQTLTRTGADGLAVLAPGNGGSIDVRGPKLEIKADRINGINVNGGNAVLGLTQEGGDGGNVLLGTATAPIAGDIAIETAITATSGANSLLTATGGKGGSVSAVSDKKVEIKGASIKVSDSAAGRASRTGGNVTLEGRDSGTAIKLDNSAQILSLLSAAAPGPGGTIKFTATQGDIEATTSTVQADRGTVDIGAHGLKSKITLDSATIRGDVVKIATMGNEGQLIIGKSTITADSLLKLYAPGAKGEIVFKDNTSLNGNSTKIIAGRTVTIEGGKTVTIGGSAPAQVFTDTPNYTGSGGNGSSSGKFGGKGATTGGFNQRPGF